MGGRRLIGFAGLLALGATPFACTSNSNVLPGGLDAGLPPPIDGSLDVLETDGGEIVVDATADVARAPDASDAAQATDSPAMLDAGEAAAPGDAGDAASGDGGDAASVDGGDAASEDASDAAVADAADAEAPDASDAGACGLNPAASSWDVTGDFSGTTNPCGVWTYGYALHLGSTPLVVYTSTNGDSWVDPANVTSGTPTVWKNLTGAPENGVAPGQVSEHPGPHGEYSTSRWTAPRSATYSVAAQFFTGDVGTTDGAILHGTTVLFEGDTTPSPTYATMLAMTAGDTLDIAVGLTGGETFNYGNTPVTFVIAEVLDGGTPVDAGTD